MATTLIKGEIGMFTGLLPSSIGLAPERAAEDCIEVVASQVLQADQMVLLGTLVAELAHDVNSPNGCIRGAVDLLSFFMKDLWSVLDEYRGTHGDFTLAGMPYEMVRTEFPELLCDMRDSSERITGIVGRLRDFSRQSPVALHEDVDVNAAMAAGIRLLSNRLCKGGRRFEALPGENIPVLRGNPRQLVQLVVCLLTNALEAVSDGERAIRIATRHDPERDCVVLEIEDEGEGMSPEVLACATTPFFTTRQAQGKLGLGLSAASILIGRFGGTLNIESVLERGTRVRVTFPIPPTTPEPH